jgi:hypothetical protein
MNQQIEHLRLDRYAFAAAGQLAKVDIQHMVGKVKLHGFILVGTSQITLSRTRKKVERIYRHECVRNLTEKEISLKNQGGLKAKSARHHSL